LPDEVLVCIDRVPLATASGKAVNTASALFATNEKDLLAGVKWKFTSDGVTV